MRNPTAPIRHYQIEPRASHLGGGWRLQCFEGDVEVAGGVFPPDPNMDRDEALNEAHCDAVNEGESWLGEYEGVEQTVDTLVRVGPGDV